MQKNGHGCSHFLDGQVWLIQLIWTNSTEPKEHELVFRTSSQNALVVQIIARKIAPGSHCLPWFVI